MKLELPALPYATNALEPHMSAHTFSFHHAKHHNAYVVKGNELLEGAGIVADTIEDLVKAAAKVGGALFNNVGQCYNHEFFWKSMKPNGGGAPTGAIAAQIDADFGSYENFKKEFVAGGVGQFGSGWVWLVSEGGKLKIRQIRQRRRRRSPAVPPRSSCAMSGNTPTTWTSRTVVPISWPVLWTIC